MSCAALMLACTMWLPQEAPQEAPVVHTPSPWDGLFESLKVYGDLRLQHESSFHLDGKEDRNRQRLRVRLGVNYQLNDEVLLGTRLVTGDRDDPNSTHVVLGSVGDDLEINLDRAFLTYRPEGFAGAFVTAGKFNHPFYRNPVYGELVWDADVQPEGVVLGRSWSGVPGLESFGVTLGGYKLLEQANAGDSQLAVGELRGRFLAGDQVEATVATSYYHYGDLTPDGATDILDDNAGNALLDTDGDMLPDEFASDFGVWNCVLGVGYSGLCAPLSFSAQYIENLRADIDDDRGWGTGLALGRSAREGDWRVYYQFQRVEQDAVFSAFAQDDFLFSTNHRSHVFGVNHQLRDNIGLHLWALVSSRDETFPGPTTSGAGEQWRVRLDLNVKL